MWGIKMPRKPKSTEQAQPGGNALKQQVTALKTHETALKKNTAALDRHAAALDANTAAITAFAALLPPKSDDDKATDARDCMRTWLVNNKRVSRSDAGDPGKSMTNDFLMNPDDMGICLTWVQGCLRRKMDQFTPDTSYAHLVKLASGTLGAVIADIVDKIKP
jgi:hypothetical protein